MTKVRADEENFKFIFRYREYFKTLAFEYDQVSAWLKQAVRDRLHNMGVSNELIDT